MNESFREISELRRVRGSLYPSESNTRCTLHLNEISWYVSYPQTNEDGLLIVPQKWLHFAIYIGTIATALLNFIEPGDTNGLIATAMFTFAALLAIAYSAAVFVHRSMRLRTRSAEGWYYDKYGPTILSVMLVSALVTNVALRLSEL